MMRTGRTWTKFGMLGHIARDCRMKRKGKGKEEMEARAIPKVKAKW